MAEGDPQELTQEGSDAQPAAKRAKIDASDAAAPPPATHDPSAAAAAPPPATNAEAHDTAAAPATGEERAAKRDESAPSDATVAPQDDGASGGPEPARLSPSARAPGPQDCHRSRRRRRPHCQAWSGRGVGLAGSKSTATRCNQRGQQAVHGRGEGSPPTSSGLWAGAQPSRLHSWS